VHFKENFIQNRQRVAGFWPKNGSFWGHFRAEIQKSRINRAFLNRQLVAGSKVLFFYMLCPRG